MDRSPAFNLLFSELLEGILASADDPAACAGHLAASLRPLIGAKTVTVLLDPRMTGRGSHEVLSVLPERRRYLAESAEVAELVRLSRGYERSVLLDPGAEGAEAAQLRSLDIGPALMTPLGIGSTRMGVLLFLDLMDMDGLATIMETLDSLARALALVIRNAFLYDNLEREVALRTEALTRALREKEAMLKEVHHRVKNNLQIVNSLLYLQMEGLADPILQDVLRASQDRIRSMALVHEELYGTEDLASVDLRRYIAKLCGAMEEGSGKGVFLSVKGDSLLLPISEAIPCGLIVTELVSNGIKYAYGGCETGELRVSIENKDGRACIAVEDDGAGLPPGHAELSFGNMGITLIRGLTDQLHGTFRLFNRANSEMGRQGARFELSFPIGERDEP